MNNNDLISRSEVRKMIEKLIDKCNRPGTYAKGQRSILSDALSELDNLSGVSGWIDVKEEK